MTTSPRYISVTDTAKLVRAALRESFSDQKFSVRSSSYAGGASIDVKWKDGPTTLAVDLIVKPFAGAHFDSLVDQRTDVVRELNGEPVHYGADYVFTERELEREYTGGGHGARLGYCDDPGPF